ALLLILVIIKAVLFFRNKKSYWRTRQFIFFPVDKRFNRFKMWQNILSLLIVILGILIVFIIFLRVLAILNP
ncbi:MAG TPA: hypothetical protein VF540_12140, partial [Segetibacter sp.]